MSIKENKIEIGNLQWFYRQSEVENDNPKALLLHGIPTHSYTWREVMKSLEEKGIQSIAPDWIGCGFSSKPNKRDFAYTSDSFVKALEDFIEALKLENFYLVVQGFLGSVAIQYALRNPEKIVKLVILNSPLTNDDKLPWKMKQWGFPFVGDMLTQDPLQVDRTLESGSGFVISDEDLNIHRKPFLETSAVGRSLMAIVSQLKLKENTTEISEGLAKWEKPTLILWGELDPWLDINGVKTIASGNSGIDLVKLPEAKHYPQEHWFKEITEEINEFFRRKML